MNNVVSIPTTSSLNAKRQVLDLLARHVEAEFVCKALKLLAEEAISLHLEEALTALAQHAGEEGALINEEHLGEAIKILAGGYYSVDDENLHDALKRLAPYATAKQLYAALLSLVATGEQLDAAIEALENEESEDDDVKPLRAVG